MFSYANLSSNFKPVALLSVIEMFETILANRLKKFLNSHVVLLNQLFVSTDSPKIPFSAYISGFFTNSHHPTFLEHNKRRKAIPGKFWGSRFSIPCCHTQKPIKLCKTFILYSTKEGPQENLKHSPAKPMRRTRLLPL